MLTNPDDEHVLFWWNYTSNMSPAWTAAGADIAKFDGKRAGDCAPILFEAIKRMARDFDWFERDYNSPNGWGEMRTLLPSLIVLWEEMTDWPDAIVGVDK